MQQKNLGEEMPGGPYNQLNNKINEHLNMNPVLDQKNNIPFEG
jgi:hypothetical protein